MVDTLSKLRLILSATSLSLVTWRSRILRETAERIQQKIKKMVF